MAGTDGGRNKKTVAVHGATVTKKQGLRNSSVYALMVMRDRVMFSFLRSQTFRQATIMDRPAESYHGKFAYETTVITI